jgi:hypothetical protein
MVSVESLDGRISIGATEPLVREVRDALTFWYAYRRYPARSLGGIHDFVITPDDFRYIEGGRFWRFTLEQTEGMLRTLWPAGAEDWIVRTRRLYAS